jgi:glucose-1-phosphate thymidylyltransferase
MKILLNSRQTDQSFGSPRIFIYNLYSYFKEVDVDAYLNDWENYDNYDVVIFAKGTSITDINKAFLNDKNLSVRILDRGTAWLDTGTFKSLMQASNFVEVIEERQGLKVGSIEEAAFTSGFINKKELHQLAKPLLKSGYGKNLLDIK